ncbi:MAG: hypothetical protein LDL41_21400, partial [Coleofasciculus sp. S288]|nr:hypothetical protein [Coleofasciculus sp. S288]
MVAPDAEFQRHQSNHPNLTEHSVDEYTSELRRLNQQLQEEICRRQLLEEKLRTSDKLLEEKLRTSEWKMRAVFGAMTDIVLILSTQGGQLKDIEVLPTNPNRLYEFDADIVGLTVDRFFEDKTAGTWFGKVQQALDLQRTLNFDYSLSLEGRDVWFTASISPLSDHSVLWVGRDISDRKQVQIKLDQQNQRLHHEIRVRQRAEEDIFFLVSTTQAIAEADDFHSALSIIVRSCCETIGWDFGEAWIPNPDTGLLEYSKSWYARDSVLEEVRNRSLTLKFAPNVGLAGRIWSSKQPEWIEDVSAQPCSVFRRSNLAKSVGLKACF